MSGALRPAPFHFAAQPVVFRNAKCPFTAAALAVSTRRCFAAQVLGRSSVTEDSIYSGLRALILQLRPAHTHGAGDLPINHDR